MPSYYKRSIDDTLAIMPGLQAATSFLDVLNSKHPSLNFTMETTTDSTLPFLGMSLSKNGTTLSTRVYRQAMNTGLYLHYNSHVDHRYKVGLLKTMLYRAYRLSSTWKAFTEECETLKITFTQLRYPTNLIDSTIKRFLNNQAIDNRSSVPKENCSEEPIMITIPFKDQRISWRHKETATVLEQQNWCASATCVHEPKNWRRLKNKGTETKNHQPTMHCVFI